MQKIDFVTTFLFLFTSEELFDWVGGTELSAVELGVAGELCDTHTHSTTALQDTDSKLVIPVYSRNFFLNVRFILMQNV